MITIKSNPYNQKEIEQLAYILAKMEALMYDKCNPAFNCKTCEYRHLCYDISSAREHAIKLVQKGF